MQLVASEEARSRAEADLRIEREWRTALKEKESELKEAISKQQIRINQIIEESKVRLDA
jgi:predicted GTPase